MSSVPPRAQVKMSTKCFLCIICMGGAVAEWLLRWTPDQAVQVRTPVGALHCVFGQETLL